MDYTVIQPNAELRATARQQLRGVWGQMALAFLVYGLTYFPYYVVTTINSIQENEEIGYMLSMLPSFKLLSVLFQIAAFLVGGPFALGFVGYFLKRVRGEEINLSNIFDGFSRFWPSFLTMFFTSLFTFLWSLLFFIPGIIKGMGYSMAFYILHDNPGISSLEAIKRSSIIMKGHKWKLFVLELSFIGWGFLCLFTFGIGYLWLSPYMSLSIANFYENLKQNQERAAIEGPRGEATAYRVY